jgi:hypothetical protein
MTAEDADLLGCYTTANIAGVPIVRILATYHALASSREEVERLTAENVALRTQMREKGEYDKPQDGYNAVMDMAATIRTLRTALAQATGDSERLEYLIQNAYTNAKLNDDLTHPLAVGLVIGGRIDWPEGVRPAIDAARTPSTETNDG